MRHGRIQRDRGNSELEQAQELKPKNLTSHASSVNGEDRRLVHARLYLFKGELTIFGNAESNGAGDTGNRATTSLTEHQNARGSACRWPLVCIGLVPFAPCRELVEAHLLHFFTSIGFPLFLLLARSLRQCVTTVSRLAARGWTVF